MHCDGMEWHGVVDECEKQDDSALNRKIIRRIIEGEQESIPYCEIYEADDGVTAVEMVRQEIEKGENFDYILMDYVMVPLATSSLSLSSIHPSISPCLNTSHLSSFSWDASADLDEWSRGGGHHQESALLRGHHHRYRLLPQSVLFMVMLNGPLDASGITGNALPEDIATFMSKGVNEVITKPLTKGCDRSQLTLTLPYPTLHRGLFLSAAKLLDALMLYA